jgi:hypothetical protein
MVKVLFLGKIVINMNKQNLLKAIELAENPGECKYFSDGKPSCVVGQLFALEGAKSEEFNGIINTKPIGTIHENKEFAKVKHYLYGYSTDILDDLQSMWDNNLDSEEDIDERKAQMVELVDNYEG